MILKRNFYNQNTIRVAKELLGCFLVREYRGKIIKAIITEVEAYRGEHDLASHASKGRTDRTEIMYGHPGYAYIYMIYGMYFMLNIVTEEKDFPAAILIRAIKITNSSSSARGEELKEGREIKGPGKMTKFLHIDKSLNGHDLTKRKKLWLESAANKKRLKIIKSPRVGIDYARHCKSWQWNFKFENKS
ncbi:MAG TPA: DNA-3-methyladenine glycosylase [Candidatus Moranbacteria bacterium]|nr:DNA-3-methyladenine glycosylase [Candidatus Moranbacteria bacterium]